jgi:hypothetical protein
MAEIYEIGEVVKKLQDTWPQDSWGAFDENSIGIVSPYSDQVSRIRVHLRHRKLFGVNVERVLNVQGKFRLKHNVLFVCFFNGTSNLCRSM